jgi:protein TonB
VERAKSAPKSVTSTPKPAQKPATKPRPVEKQQAAPPKESSPRDATPQPTPAAGAAETGGSSQPETPVARERAAPAEPSAPEAKPAPAPEDSASAASVPSTPARTEATDPAQEQNPVASTPPPPPAEPVLEPPKLLQRTEPDYPAKSLKRASGERIQLKLLISEQGRISRVLVEHGSRFKDLEAAAVSAVLRWRYEPARENGVAVEAWTTAEFAF